MPTIGDLRKHLSILGDDDMHIAWHLWTTDDVKAQAKQKGRELTDTEAEEILERIFHDRDASIGINWDVIDSTIDWYFSYREIFND